MNLEKLKKMARSVRTGGKGTVRRKKKAVRKTITTDDKRLQSTLKRIGVNAISAIEEIIIFKDDVVIQFTKPKVQASIAANMWVVSGSPQTKSIMAHLWQELEDILFINRLVDDKYAGGNAAASGGATLVQEDDDDVPELVADAEYSDEEQEEQDVNIENQYYNSKDMLEADPEGALEGFGEVLRMEPEKGEWGFKALKQTVKIYYKVGKYKEMMDSYREMLTYIKSAVTRNYSEKGINSVMKFVSGSASQNSDLCQEFYQTTLIALKESKNERLWFKTNIKLCKILFDMCEFERMNKILKELRKSCQKEDGTDDPKKGTQLLEVYAIENQMYTETTNSKKLNEIARAGHEPHKFKATDDFFRELPIDILHNILQLLSLKEAARTSVWAKMWRKLFLTRSSFVFDKKFYEEVFANKGAYTYMSLIYKILLSQDGDILDCALYIPNFPCYWDMHLDELLLKLSTKNITELKLEDERTGSSYKLHSSVYSCSKLTKLNLKNCIFKPPPERGVILSKLVQLRFKNTSFPPDVFGAVAPNLPLLKNLKFLRCSGIENLNISAHKLSYIYMLDSRVKPNYLNKFSNVVKFIFGSCPYKVYKQGSYINLNTIPKMLHRLTYLGLDGPYLKDTAATVIPGGLSPFKYLTTLHLLGISFDDSDQIACALCLLRSSPSLLKLELTDIQSCGKSVASLLQAPDCKNKELNLHTVVLDSIKGFKSEMLFIENILAHSPWLKTMRVIFEAKDAREELQISYELMQFCRASPQAKVICSGKNY